MTHRLSLLARFSLCLLGTIAAFSMAHAVPSVRISELHYDNVGTDTGEAVEISGPAGTDVTGWQIILYNGTGGASYDTRTLSGVIPATCSTRGVLVFNYPSNGIQNGSPDGIALIDAAGAVVEFLSYEGVMAATNGPAAGLNSIDIGVSEAGTDAAGFSLARKADGSWSAPAANSFGACNDDGEAPPPADVASITVSPSTATITQGTTQTFTATAVDAANQPIAGIAFSWTSSAPSIASVSSTGVATGIAVGDTTITATAPNGVLTTAALHVNATPPPTGSSDLRFSEIHYDNLGTDAGEAIEISGPAGAVLTGVSVVLYNGDGGVSYNTQTLSGTMPATCSDRGVVVIDYPANGIQNGPDGFALVDAAGAVIEFLSYEGTFAATNGPAAGTTSIDIGASQNSAPVGLSLQRDSSNHWQAATSSFGACNVDGQPPGSGNRISITGRLPTDPALPVGFEDQLFATVRDANNATVPTTITWTSDTPEIASIDARGVMRALAAGTAIIRATAADGVTTTAFSLPTRIAVASTTANYGNNAEFGEPRDNDPSDDFIVRYPQYTASYNPNRGTPNWVSYDLDASQFGAEDRCDCFTTDPALPTTFTHLSTADYTDAGTFQGYGIDRGHMTRSFDRTTASLDNAVTYYFTNVVPQAADLNQGPWALMENYLGDLARLQDKEVYIIAGVAGNKGTLKNEGKIVIPTSTWKVAVILPRDRGLADVHSTGDLEVIAVNMPNDPGVRNVPWETYKTTVKAIEQLTGYDLLALLPDDIEQAVETNTKPPVANIAGPATATEGGAITLSGSGSSDPDGSIASYAWTFGDGSSITGPEATHTYVQDGVYTVSLIVTDNDGLTANTSVTITVSNVAPTIGDVPGASLTVGQAYTAAGSFTDPGQDTWTATVNWGDGSAPSQIALTQRSFSAAHTYTAAGTFTVTIGIADDDTTTSRTQTVTVSSLAQALAAARTDVDLLVAANKISPLVGFLLKAQIATAERQLALGHELLAVVSLRAVVVQLDLLIRIGVLSAADAAPLRVLLLTTIEAIKP